MTLTLDLSPELENDLHAQAKARGVAVETLVAERLVSPSGAPVRERDEATRRAIARSLRGRSKSPGPTVDEFLAEKHAEARAEAGLSEAGL